MQQKYRRLLLLIVSLVFLLPRVNDWYRIARLYTNLHFHLESERVSGIDWSSNKRHVREGLLFLTIDLMQLKDTFDFNVRRRLSVSVELDSPALQTS